MKAGRAATAALASSALITAGGGAAALVATVVQAHPAGACGWIVPNDTPTKKYHNVPLSDGKGDTVGDITLFYEPCSQDVKGLVTTGTFGSCNSIDCVGTAQIVRNGHGQGNPCHIPNGGSSCTTGNFYDGGIQQYAKGTITLSSSVTGNVVFQGATAAF